MTTENIQSQETTVNKYKEAKFTPTESQSDVVTAQVRSNISGSIILNMFAMRQIVFGYAAKQKTNEYTKTLVAKLAIYMAERFEHDNEEVEGDCGLLFTRDEVSTMLELLNLRLDHCGEMKKNNNKQFNPDTYVAMRLLSCDLRDWLSITYA